VFFCTGVLCVQFLTSLPSATYLFVLLGLALVTFKKVRVLSYFLMGFVWASAYASFVQQHQLPVALEGKEVLISGEVVDLPTQDMRSTRFLFQVDNVELPEGIKTFPTAIRLSWYGRGHNIKSGEHWRFLVKLKRPHGLSNPHGFDYEKWLFQQNIGATGYVRDSKDNARLKQPSNTTISYWREYLRDYLDKALVGSEHLGVVKALVLGDKSDITADQWRVFRQTGTSHLIAISGLHIGLISALVFALFRWLILRCPPISQSAVQYAVLASLLAAFLYAALAGFSVPTQRALIMLFVVLGAVYLRRHYTPFHVISVALLGVLLLDPLAPLSAGFWLSFAAVAVILYGAVGRAGAAGSIKQLLSTQWWVTVGLIPLVLLFFGQVSLVSPVANILAVPLVSLLIVPLLFLALFLLMINTTVSSWALSLVDLFIGYLWKFLAVLSAFEFSSLSLSNVSLLACGISIVGVVLLLSPKGSVPKPLACVLFIPLLFPMKSNPLTEGEFKLVLLDVGQGLSAVIHTSTHTLVFDTGAKYSDKSDLASTVVMPYLRGEGIEKIDMLLISHGDNDHAGGAKTLLTELDVSRIMTSVPEMFVGRGAEMCEEDIEWLWDGVLFEIISPSKFNLFEGNNASCVLKISSINGSVLLPGDIEKNMEQSLLQYKKGSLKSDILIAPHHGSRTSSTIAFIKAVNPRYVLFPVGYKNRFGFPKSDVVNRYDQQKVKSYDTAKNGAVIVNFLEGRPLTFSGYRQQSAKFWNWKK